MASAVSRLPLTEEVWVQFWLSSCRICSEQSGTVAGFPPTTSVFPYQCHSTNALRSFTHTYRVILSVLDPRKCEYLKDYSLDFEHAYMTTYLAS